MTQLTEFHIFDQRALEGLLLGFRSASGDRKALCKLVQQASQPRWPPAHEKRLRASLARFRALDAPKIVVDNCRRELEPRAFLLDKLRAREPLAEWEICDLALRVKKPIPANYALVGWIADPDARNAGPTPEMSDPWVDGFSVTTPSVREAMFGARDLVIRGTHILGADRGRVHDVASIPAVREFFERCLIFPPPPLADYRRWYPHLHAMNFVETDAATPSGGVLEWEYASELAAAARSIRAIVAMLKNCERRKWCLQVWWE